MIPAVGDGKARLLCDLPSTIIACHLHFGLGYPWTLDSRLFGTDKLKGVHTVRIGLSVLLGSEGIVGD